MDTEQKAASPKAGLRHLRIGILALAVLAGGLASYRLLQRSEAQNAPRTSYKPLEDYGAVPAFRFTTQESLPFTSEDLLGKVSIANFIFTRCPTVCPVFSMKMQRIAEKTSSEIQLLSFSVDPEYDTPERLAAFAADYQADPRRWHFLTGEAKAIRDTVEGALKMSMEREGVDSEGVPDIVHATHFVLLDGKGRIRGYYNSDDAERIADLIRDAKTLARQSRKKS